jgi:hypothetical protein
VWLAVGFAVVGCILFATLGRKELQGYPGWSIVIGSFLSWFFSVLYAVKDILRDLRETAEQVRMANYGFKKPEPAVTELMYSDTEVGPKLYFRMPVKPDIFRVIAEAYSADPNIPFSENEWVTARGLFGGRTWRAFQADCVKRRWAAPKGGSRQGYRLTKLGFSVFRAVTEGRAKPEATPLLRLE